MAELMRLRLRCSVSALLIIIVILLISRSSMSELIALALCLVMVAIFGLAHGACDHLQYATSEHSDQSQRRFFIKYGLTLAAGAMLWLSLPRIALLTFLAIAVFHFGMEEWRTWREYGLDIGSPQLSAVAALSKSSALITLPCALDSQRVAAIFGYLTSVTIGKELVESIGLLAPLSAVYLVILGAAARKNPLIVLHELGESLGLLGLLSTSQALVAFTYYFCFNHAARESLRLSHELSPHSLSSGLRQFVRATAPLVLATILTAAACSGLAAALNIKLEKILAQDIFVTLSILTFAHVLLHKQLLPELKLFFANRENMSAGQLRYGED